MSISLNPYQERLIEAKLQSGRYRSAEEVIELALRLLDEYDRADAEWVEEVREKIDAAMTASTAKAMHLFVPTSEGSAMPL